MHNTRLGVSWNQKIDANQGKVAVRASWET